MTDSLQPNADALQSAHWQFVQRVRRHFDTKAEQQRESLTYRVSAARSSNVVDMSNDTEVRDALLHQLSLALNQLDDNFIYRVDFVDPREGDAYLKVTRFRAATTEELTRRRAGRRW